ncbi:MAG: hypothetical protein QM767_20175 [Anaeromyxobacter sp.]
MNRTRPALAFALLAALAVAPGPAAARGPSTPQERQRALKLTRQLERQPLSDDANRDRRWLVQWIAEIPDINVRSCSGPLDGLLADDGSKHGKALYAQSIFGMAAFLIEHPRDKDDWLSVQTAGVESTLKAYKAMVDADPSTRWEELDQLLELRARGRLKDVLELAMRDCGDATAPGPGDAI